MKKVNLLHLRRKQRIRQKLRSVSNGRPRLSVFRSAQHIHAQVIDDTVGKTLVSASTIDKTVRETLKTGATVQAAQVIGKLIAERAVSLGVSEVIFDRSGCIYHGRIKALAEAARENGLVF